MWRGSGLVNPQVQASCGAIVAVTVSLPSPLPAMLPTPSVVAWRGEGGYRLLRGDIVFDDINDMTRGERYVRSIMSVWRRKQPYVHCLLATSTTSRDTAVRDHDHVLECAMYRHLSTTVDWSWSWSLWVFA